MNDSDLDRFNDGNPNDECAQCGAPLHDDNPRESFDSYAEEQGYGREARIVLRWTARRMDCCRTGRRYTAIVDAIAFLYFAKDRAERDSEGDLPEDAISVLGEAFGHDFSAEAWASFRGRP